VDLGRNCQLNQQSWDRRDKLVTNYKDRLLILDVKGWKLICVISISLTVPGKTVTSVCFTVRLMGFCRVSPDLQSTICCGMMTITWQLMKLSGWPTTYVTCSHGAHAACLTQHQHTTHIWLHIELASTLRGECTVVWWKEVNRYHLVEISFHL
jgi:hypothetical protein